MKRCHLQTNTKEFGVTYDYPIAEKIHKAGKLCLMHVCMKK